MLKIPFDVLNQHCYYDNKNSNMAFIKKMLQTNFFNNLNNTKRYRLFFNFLEEHSFLIYKISDKNTLLVYDQKSKIIYEMQLKNKTIITTYKNIANEYIYRKYWILNKKTFQNKTIKLQVLNPELIISQVILQFIKCNFLYTITITFNCKSKKSNYSIDIYQKIIQNIDYLENGIVKINSTYIYTIIDFFKNFMKKFNIDELTEFKLTNCSTEKLFLSISTTMKKITNIIYKNIQYLCIENKLLIHLKHDTINISDINFIISLKENIENKLE